MHNFMYLKLQYFKHSDGVMCTHIIVLNLYSFDSKNFLKMAHRCRNVKEINTYYKFYFINCVNLLMYQSQNKILHNFKSIIL